MKNNSGRPEKEVTKVYLATDKNERKKEKVEPNQSLKLRLDKAGKCAQAQQMQKILWIPSYS